MSLAVSATDKDLSAITTSLLQISLIGTMHS